MVAAKAVSEEIMGEIKKIADRKIAVVVEGKKDRAALEKLGVSSSIFVLSRKPLFAVAEEVAANYKAVAILTDLDAEGRKLYGKLSTLLQRLGVKIDDSLRNFLFKHTQLRQIEGIAALFK
ncbi:toprim domain-containing protein [Candidatus Woesearchaeota archaeon]|nr:toprim domain-containing protein [Candidatus Woesearchaeota archaeon]